MDVKEGDLVVDANGDAVALKAGVKVFDNTGKEVEFKSGTVKMKQLVVKYEVIDGIKWSDGEALKQADFELYKKIRCDKASGATTFITCDYTGKITFATNGYTVEWKPGVQNRDSLLPDALRSTPPTRNWPTAGRRRTFPPSRGPPCPRSPRNPIGVGPYVSKKWTKSQQMEFEANPFWVNGEPKTPKLVIALVAASTRSPTAGRAGRYPRLRNPGRRNRNPQQGWEEREESCGLRSGGCDLGTHRLYAVQQVSSLCC